MILPIDIVLAHLHVRYYAFEPKATGAKAEFNGGFTFTWLTQRYAWL